ncbi:MAG: hypothetical protein GX825_02205, partial [Syntrophomonadaceae bacterium]|nr:hypothetical protein [Syntrophomonadaceae bacterium]
ELDDDLLPFAVKRVIVSPTEKHLVNKLKDKPGVILAFRMPSADTDIVSGDNYGEINKMLFYIIEKVDPGSQSDEQELDHYNQLQLITSAFKLKLLDRLMGNDFCRTDNELAKAFHTEYEYQEFGGWNGLSVSFDIKDYEL